MPSYEVTVIETVAYLLTVEASDDDAAGELAVDKVAENENRNEWYAGCKERRAEFIDEVETSEN